jgi:O-antigen/teichoic acid export membrane protein
MVVNLLGAESNAFFYVAWMISGVLASVTRAISQSLFAEGSHAPESIRQNVIRAVGFTIVLTVPGVILLAAGGKWVLLAFGSDYSSNALGLLWLLAVASLPRGLIHVYSGLLRAQDRLKELLLIRSCMAFAVLTLSSLIMTRYGIISVGYVWLGVHVLVSIAIVPRLAVQTRRDISVEEGDWEDVDSL